MGGPPDHIKFRRNHTWSVAGLYTSLIGVAILPVGAWFALGSALAGSEASGTTAVVILGGGLALFVGGG